MKTTVLFVFTALAWCASASPLRFLSFNIYGYGAEGLLPKNRAAGVEESIVKCKADVVSLQEVAPAWWDGTPLFANLSAEFGVVRGDEEEALLRAGASGTYRPPNWVNHEPLLYRKSRLNLLDSGLDFFHLSLQTSKSVTWAVLEDKETKRRFAAFATHFWWKNTGKESDTIRELNARHILWILADLRRKWGARLPAILGGDLNSTETSIAHAMLRRGGFRNAASHADIRSRHCSHHGNPVRGVDGKYHGSMRPAETDTPEHSIDHIYYTKGVHALRHDIGVYQDVLDITDHSPVLVEFTLEE